MNSDRNSTVGTLLVFVSIALGLGAASWLLSRCSHIPDPIPRGDVTEVSTDAVDTMQDHHSVEADSGSDTMSALRVVDVDRLPEEHSCNSGICTVRDIMTWDLRSVTPVAEEQVHRSRISPARFVNYLHVLLRSRSSAPYVIHFATSGHSIDLNVVTHPTIHNRALHRINPPSGHPSNIQAYAIEVDVSQESVGREFIVIVEGTFWNGFRRRRENAETYSDSQTFSSSELSVLLLFPPDRPFSNVERWEYPPGARERRVFHGTEQFLPASNHSYIYWSIKSHPPDSHYELEWDW